MTLWLMTLLTYVTANVWASDLPVRMCFNYWGWFNQNELLNDCVYIYEMSCIQMMKNEIRNELKQCEVI